MAGQTCGRQPSRVTSGLQSATSKPIGLSALAKPISRCIHTGVGLLLPPPSHFLLSSCSLNQKCPWRFLPSPGDFSIRPVNLKPTAVRELGKLRSTDGLGCGCDFVVLFWSNGGDVEEVGVARGRRGGGGSAAPAVVVVVVLLH